MARKRIYKGIPTFRKFNQKEYRFWGTYATKKEAQAEAKNLRVKDKKQARCIKSGNVYVVYIRPPFGNGR